MAHYTRVGRVERAKAVNRGTNDECDLVQRAAKRKDTMDRLCWNDGVGMYFDYDTKAKKQTRYESVTTLWPLWAGCASEDQALKLV